MTILHTLNKSPDHGLLDKCIANLQSGDALLFIEDGTYYCKASEKLGAIGKGIDIYFLKEDLAARGLQDQLGSSGEPVSYRKFVELSTKHDKVVSWF